LWFLFFFFELLHLKQLKLEKLKENCGDDSSGKMRQQQRFIQNNNANFGYVNAKLEQQITQGENRIFFYKFVMSVQHFEAGFDVLKTFTV
jgi:hypothetical protein